MRVRNLFCFLSFLLLLTAFSAAQDTNFAAEPQYLLTGSPLLAHDISTPSMSLSAPLPPISPSSISLPETAIETPFTTNPQLAQQANLVPIYYGVPNYYGVPDASAVEISFSEGATESLAALPASIVESGVTQFVDPQLLRLHGYGVPLGDVAAYWKTHKPPAQRNYTNDTIKRFHSAS